MDASRTLWEPDPSIWTCRASEGRLIIHSQVGVQTPACSGRCTRAGRVSGRQWAALRPSRYTQCRARSRHTQCRSTYCSCAQPTARITRVPTTNNAPETRSGSNHFSTCSFDADGAKRPRMPQWIKPSLSAMVSLSGSGQGAGRRWFGRV